MSLSFLYRKGEKYMNMKRNVVKSNSEFFFNLYQKLNKELLEEILDEELDVLLLEKYYLGQKIDLYSKVKGTTTGVFVESMLQKADKRHLDFLLKLIDNIEDNAIIVFQAQAFSDKILEKILNKIRKSGKKIDLYAIKIDKYVIKEITELNEIHFLKVIDEIHEIKVSNPFNIVEKYVSIREHKPEEKVEKQKISKVERRNQILIEEIRKRTHYFPTVFREKRCLDNRILSYSAGKSDVNYFISVEDRNRDSFVSIQFSKDTEDIYNEIKKMRKNFSEKIRFNVNFDDSSLIIRTDIHSRQHIYKTIDDIAQIFERFVFYLSNYIFYYGTNMEDSMWNQHKEGTL